MDVFQTGVLPTPCEDQQLLVELVGAIKVLPMDTLIQTVKSVLKQPPHTELSKSKVGSCVHGYVDTDCEICTETAPTQ